MSTDVGQRAEQVVAYEAATPPPSALPIALHPGEVGYLLRHRLAGVGVGSRVELTGTVGVHQNRLAILDPTYRSLAGSPG